MDNGIYLITKQFLGFMLYPLPMAGATVFFRALDITNEGPVWMLSKSMGMRELPWLIALLTVYTLGTLIMGSVFCIFAKFYVFT